MKCNINNLLEFVKKATVRDIIDFVQINVTEKKVSCSLISDSRIVSSVIETENNIFSQFGKNDLTDFTLNWKEPISNLIPYLKVFESENVECIISNENIILKEGKIKSKVNQSIQDTKQILANKWDFSKIPFFYEFKPDEEFNKNFNFIKRIGSSFDKIYLIIENGVLFLETSDRMNMYSNKLSVELDSVDYDNAVLNFDYRGFLSLMDIIKNSKEYTFKLHFNQKLERGLLFLIKDDGSEIYSLSSRKEF